jgi:5-methylcytosine-specific restriction endonuclease McrA
MSNHWPSSQEEIRKAREEWATTPESTKAQIRKEMLLAEKLEVTLAKAKSLEKKKIRKPKRIYYTKEEWAATRTKVFDRDGHICYVCNGPGHQVDHLLPKSKYPELALTLDNLKPICWPCNRAKNTKIKKEFLENFEKEHR